MFGGEYFKIKTVDKSKLLKYGFRQDEKKFIYQTEIIDGKFRLDVEILENGECQTRVWDTEVDEEYVLYRVEDATGAFVGEVRNACLNVLKDVADKCYFVEVFKGKQAKQVIEYIRDKYGDELEYLWEQYPEYAVWRNKKNRKWYGIIMLIPRNKIEGTSDELVEVVNFTYPQEEMVNLVDNKKYFPGWHMSKKSWYSVVLDGRVGFEEIKEKISISYNISINK